MTGKAQKIADAIQQGNIRAIGGIVYDKVMEPLMNTTDLYHAIRELDTHDILVRRVDSGGSPEWALT